MASDDPVGDAFREEEKRERYEAYQKIRNQFGGRRKDGLPNFHPKRTRDFVKTMPIEKVRYILEATRKELEAMAKSGELWYH